MDPITLSTMFSSVMSAGGATGGGAAVPDSVTIDTGDTNQSTGGGPLIGWSPDPMFLLGLAAIAAVVLLRWGR